MDILRSFCCMKLVLALPWLVLFLSQVHYVLYVDVILNQNYMAKCNTLILPPSAGPFCLGYTMLCDVAKFSQTFLFRRLILPRDKHIIILMSRKITICLLQWKVKEIILKWQKLFKVISLIKCLSCSKNR